MKKPQTCTLCEKPSIPGLHPGHGKCQYHWTSGVWGKAWADRCEALNAEAERTEAATVPPR